MGAEGCACSHPNNCLARPKPWPLPLRIPTPALAHRSPLLHASLTCFMPSNLLVDAIIWSAPRPLHPNLSTPPEPCS